MGKFILIFMVSHLAMAFAGASKLLEKGQLLQVNSTNPQSFILQSTKTKCYSRIYSCKTYQAFSQNDSKEFAFGRVYCAIHSIIGMSKNQMNAIFIHKSGLAVSRSNFSSSYAGKLDGFLFRRGVYLKVVKTGPLLHRTYRKCLEWERRWPEDDYRNGASYSYPACIEEAEELRHKYSYVAFLQAVLPEDHSDRESDYNFVLRCNVDRIGKHPLTLSQMRMNLPQLRF